MKYHINLVGRKEMNVLDKIVYFFLNYLRYILVFTQLTVLAVFFFRFTVDENIIDLKDSIAQKKAIVEVVQPLLAEAKKLNDQAKNSKEIIDNQEEMLSSLHYILSIFPDNLFLQRLTYEKNTYQLTGTTFDPKQLQLFYNRVKKEGQFPLTNLSNVKRDEDGYSFTLSLSKTTGTGIPSNSNQVTTSAAQ